MILNDFTLNLYICDTISFLKTVLTYTLFVKLRNSHHLSLRLEAISIRIFLQNNLQGELIAQKSCTKGRLLSRDCGSIFIRKYQIKFNKLSTQLVKNMEYHQLISDYKFYLILHPRLLVNLQKALTIRSNNCQGNKHSVQLVS